MIKISFVIGLQHNSEFFISFLILLKIKCFVDRFVDQLGFRNLGYEENWYLNGTAVGALYRYEKGLRMIRIFDAGHMVPLGILLLIANNFQSSYILSFTLQISQKWHWKYSTQWCWDNVINNYILYNKIILCSTRVSNKYKTFCKKNI